MKQFLKKIQSADIKYYRLTFLLSILAAVILYFWVSDDAYQGYIQVVNLVEHGVFGYNAIERVNTSTCILFELLMVPLYALTRNLFVSAFVVNIVTTFVAIYVLLYKLCDTKTKIVFSGCSLLISYYFICFCSSGLENSLIFMFSALFLYKYMKTDVYSHKDLIYLALLDSCLLLTRLDMAVMFFVPTAYIYLFKREDKSIIKMIRDGMIGLSPLFLWLLFSLWYYGVPFPTTFYAKLNTGISPIYYYMSGCLYLIVNVFVDILFSFILIFTAYRSFKFGNVKHKLIVMSFILRVFYLISIGGDFMYGRMLTDIYFMSICVYSLIKDTLLIDTYKRKILVGFLVFMFAISTCVSSVSEFVFSKNIHGNLFVMNEREFYNPLLSIQAKLYLPLVHRLSIIPSLRYSLEPVLLEEPRASIDSCEYDGYICRLFHGLMKVDYMDKYIVDESALGDMFLAQLPLVDVDMKSWRVGHNFRQLPPGYRETVMYVENRLEDENLHEYYDIVCELTRGNLFSKDRLIVIWKFNTGQYDYLLENYYGKMVIN